MTQSITELAVAVSIVFSATSLAVNVWVVRRVVEIWNWHKSASIRPVSVECQPSDNVIALLRLESSEFKAPEHLASDGRQ